MVLEIPLFPLHTVLFPHMPLPLHIFEDRYRRMMQDCMEGGTGFGVVAIREGREVGGPAEPYAVGTLARVRDVKRREDGRYDLLVTGATRFRVAGFSDSRPYLLGEVEYLQDVSGDGSANQRLVRDVTDVFRRYADRMRELASEPHALLELPEEPELLSYLVAGTLQVELSRKQELLEMDSAEDRLRGCLTLLRRENALLDRRLARRDARIAAISPN